MESGDRRQKSPYRLEKWGYEALVREAGVNTPTTSMRNNVKSNEGWEENEYLPNGWKIEDQDKSLTDCRSDNTKDM